MDNVVKLWSAADWTATATYRGYSSSVNSISLAPDEQILAAGSSDQTVKLWAFPKGEVLRSLQNRKKTVASVKISPDSSLLAIGGADKKIRIWQIRQIAQDAGLV